MGNIINKYLEQKYIIERYGQEINELRVNIEILKSQNRALQEEKDRIVNQPYYVQAFGFREKMKKLFIYRFFVGIRHFYRRLKYGKTANTWKSTDVVSVCADQVCDAQSNNEELNNGFREFNYDHMLGAHEYRFIKYKCKRNNGFRIDVNKISVPYIKDFVSVILPVYNGDDYVAIAIESVLMQTYTNFELIIIDDGSTDRTPEIVDYYASADKRIKVIHQENRKLPRTLSRGFREARGEYFTWTSADNIMHPKFLEKFVDEMKRHPRTGMLFGNIALIDEKGNPKTDFEWYSEDEDHWDHVILPKCVLELNTIANNFVGAAFMYRSVAASVVEDYSAFKYGIEDYDYWMKINELFDLRHTTFDDIEYSYRMHSKSLTSKDKELKITENRFKQMLLDDFRRNYYLKRQTWVIEGDESLLCQSFIECVKKVGHQIIPLEKAKQQTINLYERYIYVRFCDEYSDCSQNVPENAFKVIVTNKCNVLENQDCWDTYISYSEVDEGDFISAYKGWYYMNDSDNLLAFLDAKAKNTFLYDLERDDALATGYGKRFSIVVPFFAYVEEMLDRTMLSDRDEIIITVGVQDAKDAQRITRDGVRIAVCVTDNLVIRKNIAARIAQGKYLIFLEKYCEMLQGTLDGFEAAFNVDRNIATVFGNVEIENAIIDQEHTKELGQYTVEDDDIYTFQENNVPSPYCFAIRNKYLKMAGGFYNFNELNSNVGGSEEYFGLAMALQRYGYYIFLAKDCHVLRKVEKYSLKQLKEKMFNKMMSSYLLQLETILPYFTWPERLQRRLNDIKAADDRTDMWNEAKIDCMQELLDTVRTDFREKEKIDLNRDIFVRPM